MLRQSVPRTAFPLTVTHMSAGTPAAVLEKESRRGGIAPSPTGGCANRPSSTRQRYLNMHCAPLHVVWTAKCDSPTLSHKASATRRKHDIHQYAVVIGVWQMARRRRRTHGVVSYRAVSARHDQQPSPASLLGSSPRWKTSAQRGRRLEHIGNIGRNTRRPQQFDA